jgi:hypothetical protein
MSDQDKQLPIRTDQEPHDKVQVKIVDAVDPTRQAEVTLQREVRVLDEQLNSRLLLSLLQNANFLKLANFDQVIPSFSGDTTTYSYYETGALIAEARLRFASYLDWDLQAEAYINDADGSLLLDDDDSRLILD